MNDLTTEIKNPVPPQMTEEPDLWYDRFNIYVLLGVGRNIVKAWKEWERKEAEEEQNITSDHPKSPKFRTMIEWEDENSAESDIRRPGGTAYDMSKKWAWKQRARAWDAVNRQIMIREREQRAEEARERRLMIVDELIDELQLRFADIDYSELSAEGVALILKRLFEQERLDYREDEDESSDIFIFAQWLQKRESRLNSVEALPEPSEVYE